MQRRKFSREFKVEAVRLVRDRGVSAAQLGAAGEFSLNHQCNNMRDYFCLAMTLSLIPS
jgi:hypothetical protein